MKAQPRILYRHFWRELIETLLLTALLFWLVNAAIGRFRIEGPSMQPTMREGQFLFVNKLSYLLDEPARGDVIVFWPPVASEKPLVKRIIGLPGDTIDIHDGRVFVNGAPLNEPYINAPPAYSGTWQVPTGDLFVLGDNRNHSYDSHDWADFLAADDVVGKAMAIYWPPADWHTFAIADGSLTS